MYTVIYQLLQWPVIQPALVVYRKHSRLNLLVMNRCADSAGEAAHTQTFAPIVTQGAFSNLTALLNASVSSACTS